MNSKEALKKLSNDLGNYSPFQRKINIIKKDLERLEKLEKVIEILKKKRVVIGLLLTSEALDAYNFIIVKEGKLTQEEYDLLKEVLK